MSCSTHQFSSTFAIAILLLVLAHTPVADGKSVSKRVTLSRTVVSTSQSILVTGKKLPAKRKVRIKAFGKTLATAKTSKGGRFKKYVKTPTGRYGTFKLRVYIGKLRYSFSITVNRALDTTLTLPATNTSSSELSTSPSSTENEATSASNTVLVAAGDIACAPGDTSNDCQQAATAQATRTINPTAIAVLGDNQYESGSLSDFQNSFALSWGTLSSPIYPVPGNHEYLTANAAGYFAYFGTRAGDPSKGYYSYDLGDWHLIALNTNDGCASISCTAGSTQETWLRADLAAHSNRCVLAYWHHPRFSSGAHGNNTTMSGLWQALYDYNADLVLNGHDHVYERFAPQDPAGNADSARGIRQFVVGLGGKNEYGLGTRKTNSEAFDNTTFGVLKLTLNSTSYDWQYVGAAGGGFTDSGSANCH